MLGEQSVKSLRGKEMADVIFNGSSTRRALNTAETTLTFDNSQRRLAVDTPEVQITRRVYRSGEGEYLINRQPCRLRDIRDLFAGTGVATEAYSVIEQGKVDVLLQSSARDRRLIFEEAAGISRFKAKKLESQRRLERVEQNLLRLSDIVDEVDNRLRAVRLQAGKARRYREYSERLQALRTQVAAADWRTLSARLEELEGELAAAQTENAGLVIQVELVEAQAVDLDEQLSESDALMRASENRMAQNRERIAAHESSMEHERRRMTDLEEEVARYRRQLTTMSTRAVDLLQQLQEVIRNLEGAETANREIAHRLAEEERTLTRLTAQVDEARAAGEQLRAAHLVQLRSASTLSSQASALEAKVAATDAARQRGERRLAELAQARIELSTDLTTRRANLERLSGSLTEQQQQVATAQSALAELRTESARAQQSLGHLQKRHSGASERAGLLDELDTAIGRGQFGRQAIAGRSPIGRLWARSRKSAAWWPICSTCRSTRQRWLRWPWGEWAQCLVVADGRAWSEYLQTGPTLAARVGVLRLDQPNPAAGSRQRRPHGSPGCAGAALTPLSKRAPSLHLWPSACWLAPGL